MSDTPPIVEVALADLIQRADLQCRTAITADAVTAYAEIYPDLPPISVMLIDGQHVLIDGWHRAAAAAHLNLLHIRAHIIPGTTWADAARAAAQANATHGLALTCTEKRRAIELYLRDGCCDESTRKIAKKLGVSHNLVAEVRDALRTASCHDIPPSITTAADRMRDAL